MIILCKDNNEFLNICDKVKLVKNPKLTEKTLYKYMISGLYNNQVFTFVSYDKGKINGCLILLLTTDILGELTLGMVFSWMDAHYLKLYGEFINIATEKAKELGASKIAITTNRKEKVIDRRIGKYGFKKAFSVFEKRIEKEVNQYGRL